MNIFLIMVIIKSLLINQQNAFYLQENEDLFGQKKRELDVLEIDIGSNSEVNSQFDPEASFPYQFVLKAATKDGNFSKKFIQLSKDQKYPITSDKIFTISEKNQPEEIEIDKSEEWELFKESEGKSVATLIRNKNGNRIHPYRMIATIYDDSNMKSFNIFPVVKIRDLTKRHLDKDEDIYKHELFENPIVYKREQFEEELFRDNEAKRDKRAQSNGQPFSLYVEVLIVTDYSIYLDHKKYSLSDDKNLILLHMRTYFAHYINEINQRFQNSFSNDPDLKLTIRLKNFLFITSQNGSTFTDAKLVGPLNGTTSYNGREVLLAEPTLEAFRAFMDDKQLPFEYDHAVGLFNKELFFTDGSTDLIRSSAVGLSYKGKICTSQKYSISEEVGGFLYSISVTHEIAHNLGAIHDGDPDSLSYNCSSSENFLMTKNILFGSVSRENSRNLQKLSKCSIAAIKSLLLSRKNRMTSNEAECLINVPPVKYYDSLVNPGRIWSADDQCKLVYGNNATFCKDEKSIMCSTLKCRPNSSTSSCVFVRGLGAASGTTCDMGKACIHGVCTKNIRAPRDDCIFGDDVVVNELVIDEPLPYTQLSCEETLTYLSSINLYGPAYCSQERFRQTCCKTCQKYDSIICKDQLENCPKLKPLCNQTSQGSSEKIIRKLCPKTCGKCQDETLSCQNKTFICQNDGVCVNKTDVSSYQGIQVGFSCKCHKGYSGFLCDIKDVCLPNPCVNGGTCQRIGNHDFTCLCPAGCIDRDCSNCPTSCSDSVCQNNGTCEESDNGILTCNCLQGYTGLGCETETDEILPCKSFKCLNGGKCVNKGKEAMCVCPLSYKGEKCERRDDCFSAPCYNNGLCESLPKGGFKCVCLKNYTGKLCDVHIRVRNATTSMVTSKKSPLEKFDHKTTTHSVNSKTSKTIKEVITSTVSSAESNQSSPNPCYPNPCMNDGVCIPISMTTASCKCSANYIGYLCEMKNPCLESTDICQNGGTCVVTSFSPDEPVFKCICPTNFSGDSCDINLNTQCTPNTCFNRGNCSNDPDSGYVKCTCLPIFSGSRCEKIYNPCFNHDGTPVCTSSESCFVDLNKPPKYYECRRSKDSKESIENNRKHHNHNLLKSEKQNLSSTTTTTTTQTTTSSSTISIKPTLPVYIQHPTKLSDQWWLKTTKATINNETLLAATTGSGGDAATTAKDECVDKDKSACFYYFQNGYCDSSYFLNQFQMSVADFCPESCNICNECIDSQPNCVLWASLDLCPKLATFHPNPCRKSCHVC